jgi:inorganic triphosphatase YgiF
MAIEVEARFRARGEDVLDSLATFARLGPAELGPARTVHEIDRYLDTEDGRLAAARWACRLRSREGMVRISLKGPPEPAEEAWLHRRPEIDGPARATVDPGDWPASPARDRLVSLSAGLALAERLRLDQRRTERVVSLEGRRVGTLTLDSVRIGGAGPELRALQMVELELDRGVPAAVVTPLAAALAAIPGLSPEPRTKLELALGQLGKA